MHYLQTSGFILRGALEKYSIWKLSVLRHFRVFNFIFQTQLALAEQNALKQELKQRAAAVDSEDRLVSFSVYSLTYNYSHCSCDIPSDISEDLPEESDEEDPCVTADVVDSVVDPSNPWFVDRKSRKTSKVSSVVLLDAELKGHGKEASGSILSLREQRRKRKADREAGEGGKSHHHKLLDGDSCDDQADEDQLVETCGNHDIDDGALEDDDAHHAQLEQETTAPSSPLPNQAKSSQDQLELDSTAESRKGRNSSSSAKDSHIDPHSFMLREDTKQSSLGEASRQLLAVHEAFAGKQRCK